MLFELARSYHSALQKVDVSGFDTNQQGTVQYFDYTNLVPRVFWERPKSPANEDTDGFFGQIQ